IAAIDLVGARGNAIGRKGAHAVAQHVGGVAETEIKAAKIVHAHLQGVPKLRQGSCATAAAQTRMHEPVRSINDFTQDKAWRKNPQPERATPVHLITATFFMR